MATATNPVTPAGEHVPWRAPPIQEDAAVGAVEQRTRAMTQAQFEELARVGDRLSDALRLEFIDGKIGEKA